MSRASIAPGYTPGTIAGAKPPHPQPLKGRDQRREKVGQLSSLLLLIGFDTPHLLHWDRQEPTKRGIECPRTSSSTCQSYPAKQP